jgi:hypothetical protein
MQFGLIYLRGVARGDSHTFSKSRDVMLVALNLDIQQPAGAGARQVSACLPLLFFRLRWQGSVVEYAWRAGELD